MKVATPACNDSYADGTWAPLLQPAPLGATHDKLTSKDPLCNGLRAFATRFSFCLSPASNGRDVPQAPMSLTSWLQIAERDNSHMPQSASCAPAAESSVAASSSLR